MPLNDQTAEIAKKLLSQGVKQEEVAEKVGVSRSAISDLNCGRTWTQVPWPEGGQVDETPDQRKVKELEHKIFDLESKLITVRDERNKATAQFRKAAKSDGLFRAMVSEVDGLVKPFPQLKNQYVSKKNPRSEEHVVLHLSDGHHDQIVTPEECGGLERYDFPISCARGEKLVETTIDWTQNYLDKFNFPVLWVLAYGDHTSGEIHGHVNRSYFRNQFKNCFAIGQLHAMMYRELAAYFSKVCVVYVPGNHGRRSIKKDHHGAHDNWDYLIGEIAKLHSSDLENVEFIIPNSFSCNLDINGVGFNVFHGDDVRGALGIPYYGLQRRQRNMLALSHAQQGPRIRYFCCGHFHKPGSLGDMDGEMIVNGPWVATDAYAYNSFAGYTEPSQWLHGVKPSQGITWRLDVKMRRENETPKRFLIPNASEIAV